MNKIFPAPYGRKTNTETNSDGELFETIEYVHANFHRDLENYGRYARRIPKTARAGSPEAKRYVESVVIKWQRRCRELGFD
jgi:hypothetical protein